MSYILNLELLKNPWNWVMIFAMLLFASFCFYVVTGHGFPVLGTQPAPADE